MGLIETIAMAVHKRNERKLKSTSKSIGQLSVFIPRLGMTGVDFSHNQDGSSSISGLIGELRAIDASVSQVFARPMWRRDYQY